MFCFAQEDVVSIDSDGDTISDQIELTVYGTNPNQKDTDCDGYDDNVEIASGYSPHSAGKRLDETDFDGDGLSDAMELKNKLSMINRDTDGDGHYDKTEIDNGYDPRIKGEIKLEKQIIINTDKQTLTYFLSDIEVGSFYVSTGKPDQKTPKGEFSVRNKITKAWSRVGKVWMPWWMDFSNGKYGIHGRTIKPTGVLGINIVGEPRTNGCVRVPDGEIEKLYAWADVGTKVVVKGSK